MRTFAQNHNQPQKLVSANPARSHTSTPGPDQRADLDLRSQRTFGNQAAQRMLQTHAGEQRGGSTGTASPRFAHGFSRIPASPPARGAIQTKLAVSKPGDEYEREADNIAEQVMRMSERQAQRACACGGGCSKDDLSHAAAADVRNRVPGGGMAAEEVDRNVPERVATGPVLARQPAPTKPPTAPAKTVFHPGVMHNHQPSGRWADVQAAPNSGFKESQICAHFDPIDVMRAASFGALQGKWTAIDHLKWFFNGGGADFVEDSNLDSMLRTDSGVQAVLRAKIPTTRSSGTFVDHIKIIQNDYDDEDFQYAFGAIDRLDFEVNFAAGTFHAWFQDRYEWHPVYPFYSKFSDDEVRETNCVHAAAVELKSGNARDYWMKGEATIPLKALQSAASKPGLQAPKQIY